MPKSFDCIMAYMAGYVRSKLKWVSKCEESDITLSVQDQEAPRDELIRIQTKGYILTTSDAPLNQISTVEKVILFTLEKNDINTTGRM